MITYFVFCKDTTRGYEELSPALAAAWLESRQRHNCAVPVYVAAEDGSLSKVVATVTANA